MGYQDLKMFVSLLIKIKNITFESRKTFNHQPHAVVKLKNRDLWRVIGQTIAN